MGFSLTRKFHPVIQKLSRVGLTQPSRCLVQTPISQSPRRAPTQKPSNTNNTIDNHPTGSVVRRTGGVSSDGVSERPSCAGGRHKTQGTTVLHIRYHLRTFTSLRSTGRFIVKSTDYDGDPERLSYPYAVAVAFARACSCSARYHVASIAARQPSPAAVTACR